MVVAVDRECIGTCGCESKSATLRCAVKQLCEVGAVPHTGNLSQHADGHLTPESESRQVTYPERGHATGCATHPCGPISETGTTKEKGEVCNPAQA